MGYQIPLDLGLCIIKSVTKRCHLTASRDCKHMDDQKAATYFSGKTSTTWLAHGITHPPSKKKESRSPSLQSVIPERWARWSTWVNATSLPGMTSTRDQPWEGHLPLNRTTLLELLYSATPWRGGTSRKKEREWEREKSLNTERNIQMIKLSRIRDQGEGEEVGKQATLQNALWHDETDQCR